MSNSALEALHTANASYRKKLEQIEQLELRAAAGAGLDPQQLAKVAQRPVVVSALAALDGGMPTEDVAALMQAAGEASAGTSRGGPPGSARGVGYAAG